MVSIKQPGKEVSEGLTYFMPKKDIQITLNVNKDKKVTIVSVNAMPAYPDFTEYYVLKYKFNLFGENKLDVGINENGLLTSSKAIMTSKVNEALGNLAYSARTLAGLMELDKPDKEIACPDEGNYIFMMKHPYDETKELCGMKVKITQTDKDNFDKVNSFTSPESIPKLEKYTNTIEKSGVYYRQLVPYEILITKNVLTRNKDSNPEEAIANGDEPEGEVKPEGTLPAGTLRLATTLFLPSSKTFFLPISKTFFADNSADFSFVDGMPTKYVQETKSEFAALFKLPGDIIGGFMKGLGAIFENFKTINTSQSEASAASLQNELIRYKTEMCLAAMKKDDKAYLNENCSIK